MQFKIDYLARHENCLPLIAGWHLAEFGYLNPTDTLESRTALMPAQANADLKLLFATTADLNGPAATRD